MAEGGPAWPGGKRFAFTIVDDTDCSTLANVRPVYDLLQDLGFRTTKTVWPLAPWQPTFTGGATLADPDYLKRTLALRDAGFEIASHGATDHSSERADTLRGLNAMREVYGADPRMHITHCSQQEGLYWGAARFSGAVARLYGLLRLVGRRSWRSSGHEPDSPYYWGDLCAARLKYVRGFGFDTICTTSADPYMPYHDPARPDVPYWFSAANARSIPSFLELLSEASQEQLETSGAGCIVYTHFALGFMKGGALEPRFRALMERLAQRPGWFVPASDLLDHLAGRPGRGGALMPSQHARLQRRFLVERVAGRDNHLGDVMLRARATLRRRFAAGGARS